MIARVFPRKTNATPRDEYAFIGCPPPLFLPDDISEVHVSVVFTWDMKEAERLAEAWEARLSVPVKIGGPATGMRGEDFVPGRYLKPGYVITSRGCPNTCWFCSVHAREGTLRELPITDGWNLLDDNILACSRKHFEAVCEMLERSKRENHQRIMFTGGLEAAQLKEHHAEILKNLFPKIIYFAYDTPDDFEPLRNAVNILKNIGYRGEIRCYTLIGYPNDTMTLAEQRLTAVCSLGIYPMAMLYRDREGKRREDWRIFQREWVRPAIIYGKLNGNKAKIREKNNAERKTLWLFDGQKN